jgi:hypothetical protein
LWNSTRTVASALLGSEEVLVLTDEQVDQFHRDGYLAGGSCLTDSEVEELRAELERVISDRDNPAAPQPSLLRNLADLDGDASGRVVWQIVNVWIASAPFRRLLEHPKITSELAQLTDADELRVWHDQIQYKPAEYGGETGWHQDAPAWPVIEPMTEVSAWVALDDVDESNGCMSMVPGSHRWGDATPRLAEIRDFDELPRSFDGHAVEIVRRPVRKGEVHYHHALTWHGSHSNYSARPRRAIAIHYMPEGTRFVAAGQHPIKDLIDVPDGAPVEGRYFPLCYVRDAKRSRSARRA